MLARNPRFNNLLDPKQQEDFANVFKRMDAAARKKNQKVIYTVVDEGTNSGEEGISELAARILKEKAPEVRTIGDINGYRELMRCAPWLSAAGFNNGWQGGYSTNREDHMLMVRTVIQRVASMGCEPWFVNGGLGRYPFGVFFWKMQSIGVKGKVEWHFYAATSDPFNPFDATYANAFGSVVFPNRLPTLHLEGSRQGIYDLRYARTLQRVVAEKAGEKDPSVAARVQVAKEALDYWIDQVPDAFETPATGDGSAFYAGKGFPPARLMQFREEMGYHLCRLLKVRGSSLCPPEFVLASWEKDEQNGWTDRIQRVSEHATHGMQAGKLVFKANTETYFDAWGRMRTKDWRGYTSFRLDAFNPQDRDVTLTLVLRDQLASNVSAAVSARKTIAIVLKPGANSFVLPLAGLRDDGGERLVDLSCVFNGFFTMRDRTRDAVVFIDNMRLVQDE